MESPSEACITVIPSKNRYLPKISGGIPIMGIKSLPQLTIPEKIIAALDIW